MDKTVETSKMLDIKRPPNGELLGYVRIKIGGGFGED